VSRSDRSFQICSRQRSAPASRGQALAAGAVPAASSTEHPCYRAIVTGSSMERTEFETTGPVQVITAADLQASGSTTVSDVFRNVLPMAQPAL